MTSMLAPDTDTPPCTHGPVAPHNRDRVNGDNKHRDASSAVCQAIDLLTRGQEAYRIRRLSAFLRHAAGASGVRHLAIGADVIYEGAPLPIEQVDTDAVVRRIAPYCRESQNDDDYAVSMFINGYPVILSDWDIWRGDEVLAEELLVRSLQGDDAAHCALEIAALVGDSFWKSFADTSTHFCTGRAPASVCPAWLVDAAMGSANRNQTGEVCDAAILCDALTALEHEIAIEHRAGHGRRIVATTDSDKWRSEVGKTTRPASRVTVAAINVAPGFWIVGATGVAAMTEPQLVTTRQVSHALAHVRAMGSGARVYVAIADRRHRLAEPAVILSSALRRASVAPGDPLRRDALANMIAFADRNARERLGSILAAVASAGIQDDRPSTPGTSLKRRDDTIAEPIRVLGRLLRATDEARLRARLGLFWDHGGPRGRVTMTFGGHRFKRDVDGMWRDRAGRIVLWGDFVRLACASRVNIYCCDGGTVTSRDRIIPSRTAQYGPAHAPDLAYALCRDAMAGVAHATDWLAILSVASPTWETLYVTARNVVRWIEDKCSLSDRQAWSDPLIDWVLDVPPHKDSVACLGDVYDKFNTKLVDTITARGGRIDSRHMSSQSPSDGADDAQLSRSDGNPSCRRRICRTLSWIHVRNSVNALERHATCKSVLMKALTHGPIGIDGRQILATESVCHLLGERARGVYALVRALYTVDSLRDLIIHRTQAEMVPILTDTFL